MRAFGTSVVNVSDLRERARRRLPRMVFDYLDGGAETERTLRENVRAYSDVLLRPRSAELVPSVDLSTTVLGHEIAVPFLFAPIGSSRMFWPRAEAEASNAAGKAGTVYILSTLSGTKLEEVKAATSGPCWFQLYLCGGRDVALGGIARAKAAGYSTLVVTIDTPVAGLRERDVRNGTRELLSGNPLKMLPHLPQILVRPRWLYDFFADGGLMSFPNVLLPDGPMQEVQALLDGSLPEDFVVQTLFAPRMIIPLAYDSGGVTTSTVTVPLVAALGFGLAENVPGRSPLIDGFGLIAFASLFPIMSVMAYAQLAEWRTQRKLDRLPEGEVT